MTQTTQKSIDVVFSFDTTGSMYACLDAVRRVITKTTKRLFKDIPEIRIGMIAHGDYCDGPRMIDTLELCTDAARVDKFVNDTPPTAGGDFPECYEYVLNRARSFNWSAGRHKALVMVGDAIPHGPNERQNTKRLNWRNELKLLLEAGINVHAVQCLSRPVATPFWREMAEVTGGHHLQLNQFSNIVDLICALAYHQADQFHGTEQRVDAYEQEIDEHGRMTRELAAIFDKIKGRKGGAKKTKRFVATKQEKGLKCVAEGRFQTLSVRKDTDIKGFVKRRRLPFKVGRGFYELTKTVTVQPQKEVILENHRTGAMYTGAEARKLLGLSDAGNVRVNKAAVPPEFRAFIQSTSANRKLLGGTTFLYEVSEYG